MHRTISRKKSKLKYIVAALAENGVANITNTIQQAVNATIERALEDISTEIGQLVAPLLAQLKHLHLPGKTPRRYVPNPKMDENSQ